MNNAGPPYTAGQAESSTNLWSRRERTGHVLFLSAGVESHVSPDTCAVSSHVCIKGHVSWSTPKSVQYVVIYLWRQYFYMPWIWKQANFLFKASFYRFQSLWCSFLSEYFSLFPQSSLLPVRKAFDSLNHCLDTFFRTFQHRNIF